MSWAVLQTEVEPPTVEQLQSAFHQVPGLTAMDSVVLGRDAFGVLAKGLDLDRASAMQAALAAAGVTCEVVDDTALTELPMPRQLSRAEFTPEALRIDDLLGHVFSLEWQDIAVVAAGWVRVTEFKKELVEKIFTSGRREYSPEIVVKSVTREERKDHLLLEIITRGAAVRYHTIADQPEAMLLFQSLGEGRTRNAEMNLTLFVQQLAQRAPAAVLNHGAFFMRESGDSTFHYASKTGFYREITWLFWMIDNGRVQR